MELQVSTPEGLERDSISRGDVTVVGQVWPPSRKRRDELHAREIAQAIAQLLRGTRCYWKLGKQLDCRLYQRRGFTLDASVRIEGLDRDRLERRLRHCGPVIKHRQ